MATGAITAIEYFTGWDDSAASAAYTDASVVCSTIGTKADTDYYLFSPDILVATAT